MQILCVPPKVRGLCASILMTQTLSSLHPNPGWAGDLFSSSTSLAAPQGPVSDTVGKHCILELYDCCHDKLNDEAFLRDAITDAAKRAGATQKE